MSNQFGAGEAKSVQVLRAGVQGKSLGQRKDMAVVGMEGPCIPGLRGVCHGGQACEEGQSEKGLQMYLRRTEERVEGDQRPGLTAVEVPQEHVLQCPT